MCPEKNRSAPNVSLLKISELIVNCDGKGPIWVRVIKTALIMINRAPLFIINGILGIGALIGYGMKVPLEIMLGGLIVWDIVMPLSTALLAYLFWNARTIKTEYA